MLKHKSQSLYTISLNRDPSEVATPRVKIRTLRICPQNLKSSHYFNDPFGHWSNEFPQRVDRPDTLTQTPGEGGPRIRISIELGWLSEVHHSV